MSQMIVLKMTVNLAAGPPVEVWESPAEVVSTFFALAAVGFIKLTQNIRKRSSVGFIKLTRHYF